MPLLNPQRVLRALLVLCCFLFVDVCLHPARPGLGVAGPCPRNDLHGEDAALPVHRLLLRLPLRGGGKSRERKTVATIVGSKKDESNGFQTAADTGGALEMDAAADDDNFESWLAGWQGGAEGVARKRERADVGGGEEKTTGKARSIAGNTAKDALSAARPSGGEDAVKGVKSVNGEHDEDGPDVVESEELFETAMRSAVKEQREGKESKERGGEEDKKSRNSRKESTMKAEKWPEPAKARKMSEAEMEKDDAAFLKKVRLLEESVGGAKGLFTSSNITEEYIVPDYDMLEPSMPLPTQYLFNRSDWMAGDIERKRLYVCVCMCACCAYVRMCVCACA